MVDQAAQAAGIVSKPRPPRKDYQVLVALPPADRAHLAGIVAAMQVQRDHSPAAADWPPVSMTGAIHAALKCYYDVAVCGHLVVEPSALIDAFERLAGEATRAAAAPTQPVGGRPCRKAGRGSRSKRRKAAG